MPTRAAGSHGTLKESVALVVMGRTRGVDGLEDCWLLRGLVGMYGRRLSLYGWETGDTYSAIEVRLLLRA